MRRPRRTAILAIAVAAALGAAAGAGPLFSAAGAPAPASPGTIVDQWGGVKPPPAPPVKAVTADPPTTAFLVLDIVRQTCTILPEVRPLPGAPLVAAGPDKFLGTDLEAILRGRSIKTVIVSGTAAHGAVLSTSSEAAMRGFEVYLPADLLSAETTYAEQYTVWHLTHAPVFSPRVTLTRSDLIRF